MKKCGDHFDLFTEADWVTSPKGFGRKSGLLKCFGWLDGFQCLVGSLLRSEVC